MSERRFSFRGVAHSGGHVGYIRFYRSTSKQLRPTAYGSVIFAQFDKVILTYPVLYKYFYQGQDLNSDDPEYAQAMAATQLLANYFEVTFNNGHVPTDVAG